MVKLRLDYLSNLFLSQSPYGEPVEPDKAPEAISKAVASLPPEQMFELMKQMKVSQRISFVTSLSYYLVK